MIDSSDVRAALERQERFAPDPAAVRDRVQHPRRTSRWPILAAVAAAVVAVVVVVAVVHGRSSAPLVGVPPVSSVSATASTPAQTATSPSVPSTYVGIRWVLTSASIDGQTQALPTTAWQPPSPVPPADLELFPDGTSSETGPGCFQQSGRWVLRSGGFELVDQRIAVIFCYLTPADLETAGRVLTSLTGPLTVRLDGSTMTVTNAHVHAVFTNAGPASRPEADIYSASTSSSSLPSGR